MTPCIRIVFTISFDCLTEILALFPNCFGSYINDPCKLDELEEVYLIYQSIEEINIPKDIWDAAAVRYDEAKKIVYHRMDIWAHLRPKLPQVTNTALLLLTIPHRNVAGERVFSVIGKNNTKFRSTLDLATSLNAIMLIKMNQPEHLLPCHFWEIPNELLKRYKSASREYNQEHSSKRPCKYQYFSVRCMVK